MDDYLTEKEQIERIKQWWHENGWFLIGGLVVVGLGYFGLQQYRAYQQRTGEEAAAIYLQLKQAVDDDDREQADSLLGQLEDGYASSAYFDQARLLIASDNLIRDTARSITELTAVMDDSRDEGMAMIARLRLARVLAYDEQYDRALDVLNVPNAGEYAPRLNDIKGDIYAAMGNTDSAVNAYTDALLGSGNGTVDTEYLQLKLNDLIQAQVDETADTVAAPADTGTAVEDEE
jgi:predicted negative regulator of RcsB-dependent stress response